VPYYWNIAPNMDFTAEPIEYSRRNIDLGGDFRYLEPGTRTASCCGTICRTTPFSAAAAAMSDCATTSRS
jgi:hypothetical protein